MLDLDDHRRRMLEETSRFIEWGLANPDKVRWIPRKRIGEGGFSESMSQIYWRGVFGSAKDVSRDLVGRFLRWVIVGRSLK